MRDFRVSRERVSIAVTKLRSNRRQTGPLTNLHATINNVKANSRIERRSRTTIRATSSVATRRGARVFPFVSTTKRRVLACDATWSERERAASSAHASAHTSLERDFPRQRKETAGISSPGRRFPLQKSRTRMRPSPGSSRFSHKSDSSPLLHPSPFPFNLLVSLTYFK